MVYPLSAKTALQPCLLLFNCHGKPPIFAIVCDKSKLLKSKQKAPNFWSPAPSNCVSLQKYSVFSTMQGCIVPPKSNKLIACVWNVAKTCVLDSFKTVKLFLSFQRILSIWNQFRPVLQGELLEQVRIPTALSAVPFIQPFDWLKGWFCVYTFKPSYPCTRLLSVVFCMSAVLYYLLLHFLPFEERPLTIWRFVGELSRTFRPCVVRVWTSFRSSPFPCLYSITGLDRLQGTRPFCNLFVTIFPENTKIAWSRARVHIRVPRCAPACVCVCTRTGTLYRQNGRIW